MFLPSVSFDVCLEHIHDGENVPLICCNASVLKNLMIITSGCNQAHSQAMNTVGAAASIAGVYPEISLGRADLEAIYIIYVWFQKLCYENHIAISEPTSS
jgi:hypothetical protein